MKFYVQKHIFDGVIVESLLLKDDDGILWSFKEGHRFYNQYLIWLEEGNILEEWNPDNIDNGTE